MLGKWYTDLCKELQAFWTAFTASLRKNNCISVLWISIPWLGKVCFVQKPQWNSSILFYFSGEGPRSGVWGWWANWSDGSGSLTSVCIQTLLPAPVPLMYQLSCASHSVRTLHKCHFFKICVCMLWSLRVYLDSLCVQLSVIVHLF